jgi:hypothetical protein
MDRTAVEDYNAGWTQILPTDNIKDTALATNLKLLCGICTNWRMLYPLIEDAKPLLEKFSID